jgi:hypothetical protein
VLLNVGIVINLWRNIDFLGMDSYLCEDSEELYRRYEIVGPGVDELFGIVGIYELARAGRTEDVLEGIQTHWDLSLAFDGACHGGHKELVKLLIRKIRSSGNKVTWDTGLTEACRGGSKELALLMMENGAREFGWGLEEACRNNQKELALLMIQKIKSPRYIPCLNGILSDACYGGRKEMAELMIHTIESMGGTVNFDWALSTACTGGHKETILLMIRKIKSSGVTVKCGCDQPLEEH